MKKNYDFKEIVDHLKDVGFFYASSEIYGGVSNTWDFGPLGSEMKMQVKNHWWSFFVNSDRNMHGIDSAIMLKNSVWEASGHLSTFADKLIDCRECKKRFKIDDFIDSNSIKNEKQLKEKLESNSIKCPNCGKSNFTDFKEFNLMFKVMQGKTLTSEEHLYLRPETAQGIFLNYKNVLRTTRAKVPFGIGQTGKSFRNEITPSNFIFRTKEFEQMEIEFFCKEENENTWFDYFKKKYIDFFNDLGINKSSYSIEEISKDELAHYSKRTVDFFYNFPFGKSELMGIANRGTYDLISHQDSSGVKMEYLDPSDNKKFIPTVIEPSIGLERLILAILSESYNVEKINDDTRIVMKLPFIISPYQIAILPLSNKLEEQSLDIFDSISKKFGYRLTYDRSGSIGKRYRRQDSIGTKYCITVDFDTEKDLSFTIRERDTMKQERMTVSELGKFIESNNG